MRVLGSARGREWSRAARMSLEVDAHDPVFLGPPDGPTVPFSLYMHRGGQHE